MKALIALALAAGTFAATAPANAAQGCGPGGHRGPYGHCRPNRGPVVYPGPGPVIGTFYRERGGYWDGHRYWANRRAYRGGYRYY